MFDPYDADSNEDDPEVETTEWTWGKDPISCPWVKKAENAYDFNVKKANKFFNLLLEKKHLRLPTNHVIPSTEELKGKKYCKFQMLLIITLTSAESFAYIFRRPLSKGKSSLNQPRNQQWT